MKTQEEFERAVAKDPTISLWGSYLIGASDANAKTLQDMDRRRKRWSGAALKLRYTDAQDLVVIHHLPGSAGWFVMVVGNPWDGAYEWVVSKSWDVSHSDCGYGDSDVALRDGLIAMHGEPKRVTT